MNAGAFGQEIEQTTVKVKGFQLDGSPFEAGHNEINFNYRRVPQLERVVITSGEFQFKKTAAGTLKQRMNDILALRAKKQPLNYPSCGSVFKRPPGYYAGALIEEAGLKGERVGDAMVSPKHAGFILNTGNADAADVFSLIRRRRDRVIKPQMESATTRNNWQLTRFFIPLAFQALSYPRYPDHHLSGTDKVKCQAR
jgi:UDP-N-acetylmuramate dehydrogenase